MRIMINWADYWQYVYWMIAYLIGGISFAYLIGRVRFRLDLRQHGSGNLGATNVLRVLGKGWGFSCLFLDVLKGALPVYLSIQRWDYANHYAVVMTGIFAILGHIFTPYLGFRGGKGVATSLGVFAMLVPYPVLLGLLLFFIALLLTGYVALGSLVAGFSVPLISLFFYGWETNELLLTILFLVGILVFYTHRSNIRKMLTGRERKISHFWNHKER